MDLKGADVLLLSGMRRPQKLSWLPLQSGRVDGVQSCRGGKLSGARVLSGLREMFVVVLRSQLLKPGIQRCLGVMEVLADVIGCLWWQEPALLERLVRVLIHVETE